MNQVHGIPALLSLYFPGLGQLVKGQWQRAAFVWWLMFVPWAIWFVLAIAFVPEVLGTIRYAPAEVPAMLLKVFFRSPGLVLVLLVNLIVHLWAVVDAYQRSV